MKIDFSIVVPAYNEGARLGRTLAQIFSYLKKQDFRAEVIVVDDGSSDGTAGVAREAFRDFPGARAKLIRYEENRGKGYAVRTGFMQAEGEIALFSDADLSTPIEEMPKLCGAIQKGACEVAFGSRALDRSLIEVRQPWRREQGGKVFNLLVRSLTGLPFWDTQCGFKAFRMEKFRPLLELMKIERFGFDVEFLFVANYRRLRLKEIPVRWNHCEGTKVDVLRDSRRMFREILEIRRHARRGAYDPSPRQEEPEGAPQPTGASATLSACDFAN